VLGICWLGNAPVSLTLLERCVGPRYVGTASSYYWGIGNFGIIALVPLIDSMLEFRNWYWAAGTMVAMMSLCLGITLGLPAKSEAAGAGDRGR
jgi:hypothetical protein